MTDQERFALAGEYNRARQERPHTKLTLDEYINLVRGFSVCAMTLDAEPEDPEISAAIAKIGA